MQGASTQHGPFFVRRETLFWVLVECRSPFSAENTLVRPASGGRATASSFVSVSLLIVGPAAVRLPSVQYSVSVPLARFPSVVLRFLNRSLINATQVGPERISDRREIEIALAERAEQLWCENGRAC